MRVSRKKKNMTCQSVGMASQFSVLTLAMCIILVALHLHLKRLLIYLVFLF